MEMVSKQSSPFMELRWGSSEKQFSPFMEVVSKQFSPFMELRWGSSQESSPPRLWKWLASSSSRLWKWLVNSFSIYGTVLAT